MHRVVAGCNLWGLLFLVGAFVLGWQGSPFHVRAGLFAAIFALLAQSAIFALFMGASKLLQEHVLLYALPASLIERTNALMIPLFRRALTAALALLGFALLAGLGASGDVPVWAHVAAGAVAIGVVAAVLPSEVRALRRMHGLLAEMEAAIPEGPAPGPKAARAAGAADFRGRALVYVGSTVLAMVLGYRYISGLPLPTSAVALAAGFSVLCLGLAALLKLRAGRAGVKST